MLSVQNLSKTFNSLYKPVLNNINLSLKEGEFCVLIGSNGSGKSTFLRSILDGHEGYTGQITINNKENSIARTKPKIAYVDQNIYNGTISEMTLMENIALGFIANTKSSFKCYKHYREKALSILSELDIGLEKYIDRKLLELSGGQRQIIATIIAIISKPALLLLDEHTSALDPKMQKFLMDYTNNKIKQANITSIMITHKLEDALSYGNRLIMLHEGQIVFESSAEAKSSLKLAELTDLFYKFQNNS